MPDAYRRYLPDASRVDRLPSYGGYGLLVLPVPLVSAEEGLTEQVQAAVQAAGPVWLAGMDVPHCRTLFPAEDGYFVQQRTVPLDTEHRRRRSRWESRKEEYVEVRYAPAVPGVLCTFAGNEATDPGPRQALPSWERAADRISSLPMNRSMLAIRVNDREDTAHVLPKASWILLAQVQWYQ